jgi:hypothetical protein
VRQTRWLPVALWPLGIAAVAAGFVLLFDGEGGVTFADVILRSVGGSFIACGLIAWQRRPDSPTGGWMTLTGFTLLAGQLLAEAGAPAAYTLGEVVATWWYVPFAALVLSFPGGRIGARTDRLIVAGFVFGGVVLQLLWLLFLQFPPGRENVILISADDGVADAIDQFQRLFNSTMGAVLAGAGAMRWLRASPPLRRLLLPTLAGSAAVLILALQGYYRAVAGEFVRSNQEITAIVLFSVPLAYLLGILRSHYARAGMADLVVALQSAPDVKRLSGLLGAALGDR